ncbi:hypothetical protein B0H13DRAFT_1057182 [Mycena leptocephala]|nr:hypothetical protein B0H13DRAFT_1057182 [Mycena leptocephala]
MSSLTIPIPVATRTQRTLKLVGFGIKAVLTTKVPGKLVVRKKRGEEDSHCHLYVAPHTTPPVPDPTLPTPDGPPEGAGLLFATPLATVFPEDIHQDLVSCGIKVRDFAYPATRVGHTNPTHSHPMALTEEAQEKSGKEKAKDIPLSAENAPMPSISTTWTVPHPSLRPVSEPESAPFEVPTLEKPYHPVYETHRIPGAFNPPGALLSIQYRLSQNPRTVPIRGLVTRRLLTLSPHLVDLSRYHEMDLEELRRYDRCIVWQLMNGIEPYPWYSELDPAWTPDEEELAHIYGQEAKIVASDVDRQRELLYHGFKCREEDNLWEHDRLQELRRENARNGLVYGTKQKHLSRFDKIITRLSGVTLRQVLDVWERRRDSDRMSADYDTKAAELERLRAYDLVIKRLEEGGFDGDLEVEMPVEQADPYAGVAPPFILGQREVDLPPLPYWGPNAVWDGYRLRGGEPTGKTLNEYVAELSSCVDDGSPWPPPPCPKRKFEELSDSDEEGSEEGSVEDGPSRKRARM